MGLLCDFDWPGNVRQLENLVRRLVILNDGQRIEADALPAEFHEPRATSLIAPRVPQTGLAFREVVEEFEADLILQALELTQWNKSEAAQLLRLNRTTLLEKIKKKGLDPPRH